MADVRTRRRKKKNRRGRLAVTVSVIVLISIFAARSAELAAKNSVYERQIVALQKEYDKELARQDELKEREKYMQTKKFVEEYAKERLGLIYPNEVVFKAE